MTDVINWDPRDVNDLYRAGLLPADMAADLVMMTPEMLADDDEDDELFNDDSGVSEYVDVIPAEEDVPAEQQPEQEDLDDDASGSGGDQRRRIVLRRPSFDLGDHAEIADKVMEILSPNPRFLVHDVAMQYRYNQETGSWEGLNPETISWIIKNFSGCPKRGPLNKKGEPTTTPMRINLSSCQGGERLLAFQTHNEGFFDGVQFGVAFKNGFLGIKDGIVSMRPNSPNNRCRTAFPFDYDPDTKHPMLDSFFEEVFADCGEEERAIRECILQEAAGAALFGMATSYQKCLLLFGPGGCGKSQFADMSIAMFPRSSVASTPPQRWIDKFALSQLAGVVLNVVAEMPEAELVNTDVFKSMIVGDQLTAERKFQAPFNFKPRAAHFFMANKLPSTSDISDAFFRRWICVAFTRKMSESPNRVLDIGKKIAAVELPGIVTWAVDGAKRLQRSGKYTESQQSMDIIAKWRQENDKVEMFIAERYDRLKPEDSPYNGTKSTTLYSIYKSWSSDGNFKTVSSRTFSNRMEAIGLAGKRMSEGVYYPVQMKENVESSEE